MEQKHPKDKKKAKRGFLADLTKKQKISIYVISIIAMAGIIGGIFIFIFLPKGGKCIIGTPISDINAIDPILAFYREQIVVTQVCEGLFDNDFSSGNPELINVLATGYEWSDNATELTCTLRQGVKFHDGTPFNAAAVKWNFDRIYRLLELFPQLLNGTLTSWGDLYLLPDDRPIVNETQVINDYTVKFVLNEPFVPFLQLLTHPTTSFLSPVATPYDEIIDLLNGELVGTGPFTYDDYEPHVNVIMSRNLNYWGKNAKLDKIELKFYQGNITYLLEALLRKDIHFLDPFVIENVPDISIELFKNDLEFTVQRSICPNFRFISMNNNSINITMREAISYAINYSYFVENVTGGKGIRARSPIPEGCIYSNTTAFELPEYNITHARKLLKDVGWPGTESLTVNDNVSAGNEWELKANSSTPLETYNLSGGINLLQERTVILLPEYLKQIGVKLNVTTPFHFEHLAPSGWYYDYNDPHNALYSVFSYYNLMELNDSSIFQWIDDGAKETNTTLREQIYYNIQQRLIEVLHPVVWTYSTIRYIVYISDLSAWQPNPYKILLKNAYFK
ncbi:MAG: ABC transporter substrate-binding protein [Promethearchaeota archaeon]